MRNSRNMASAVAMSSPHVIVCGNEKGGSGKSTLAMHIAVALLKSGFRVATIDLDGRQRSLTRYIDNRRAWSGQRGVALSMPRHSDVTPSPLRNIDMAEADEAERLLGGIEDLTGDFHYVVVDTPGSDTYLNRLAHRIADTLVTPMNDSFVDLDVIGRFGPASGEVSGVSQYAEAVRAARSERIGHDERVLDWIVVRNRLGNFSTRNERSVDAGLRHLATELGFRLADGISERVIFRELFPLGVTVIDELDEKIIGVRPTLSHLAARQEIRRLISALNLPTDQLAQRRAEMRRQYLETAGKPLKLPDIFAI